MTIKFYTIKYNKAETLFFVLLCKNRKENSGRMLSKFLSYIKRKSFDNYEAR